MHESSIARQVLSIALARAAGEGDVRLTAVRGHVAETEALSIASVRFHFDALARGTAAEGAVLELELRRLSARCRACARTYEPDHHLLLCPSCGFAGGEVVGEPGIAVHSIDVEPSE
jgi:hydrogenase nickel incorporation protein HypA/HybF